MMDLMTNKLEELKRSMNNIPIETRSRTYSTGSADTVVSNKRQRTESGDDREFPNLETGGRRRNNNQTSGTGGANSQVRENINRFNNPQSDTRNNSGRSFADAANIPRVEVTEPNGTIQQQRPRRQGLIMGNNKDTNIQGVEKNFAADVQLAATGINKDVTAEDMENWLKGKGLNAKCEIKTKQEVWEEVRKITMKVTIPANEMDKATHGLTGYL